MNDPGTGKREQKPSKIQGRKLTSLITLTTFLVMAVTGLILFFVPEGRIAYWVHWKFLGLSKESWGNIHLVCGIVFIVTGAFHIYFNWKPLINYLSDKFSGRLTANRELMLSLAATVVIIIGAIVLFPPFDYVVGFSGYLKSGWVKDRDYEPPFGHAEETSLKIFARKMDIDLPAAVSELKDKGILFDTDEETLEEIAVRNGMTPMDIYVVIKKFEENMAPAAGVAFTPDMVDEQFTGTGLGRKQLPWLLEDLEIDPGLAEEKLAAQGIEIKEDETMKAAGTRYGIDPIDILKIILVEGYTLQNGSEQGEDQHGK
jgi:hypothetical protein